MFALPRTHWECPKCTMLCPVKHMRCTMCLFRQPRQKSFTPEIVEGNQNCTPEIQKPAKKRKKKSQRHLFKKQQQRSTAKEKSVGVVLNTHERDRQRVNKAMETNKIPSKKRGEYSIQDMRRALWCMVKGASAWQVWKEVGIPVNSLRRNFFKCLGFKPSKHHRIDKKRWAAIETKIARYEFAKWGGADKKRLLPDEEELIVSACEFAAQNCFPWSPYEITRLAWSMMKKMKKDCPCPGRGWLRGFEKRWANRLQKCKTSSIDPVRAKQATTKVRDEVYNKFVAFRKVLIETGQLTEEQLQHEEDFIINIDEVGGDELGKRIKCYQPTKANKSIQQWRNIEIGGDHNPFHCTSLFGTIANGRIADFWTIIHSSPGCKSNRVRSDYLHGIPG